MIIETIFWIAFVAVTRVIARTYERRRDVLYGPYIKRINSARATERV
jgi:hypothetical protein